MLKRTVMMTCAVMVATATGAAAQSEINPAACKPTGSLMRLAGCQKRAALSPAASRRPLLGAKRLWNSRVDRIRCKVQRHRTRAIDRRRGRRGLGSVASAPCGNGTVLYIADIGDNDGNAARSRSIACPTREGEGSVRPSRHPCRILWRA